MSEEKNVIITYEGTDIVILSDERNDYVSLTDMAKAWKNYGRKSIAKWLRNKQTIEFLTAWERKHNQNFNGTNLGAVLKAVKDPNFTLSVEHWLKNTNSIGIFTRSGVHGGTYAHKDIAIRFGGWLSPEFEIYLVEEIQRLKHIEQKIHSYDLLDEQQILYVVKLKEIFKYVAHQTEAENAHKEVYASNSKAKNPFAEFNIWRNKILDISPETIDARIRQYCIDNNIALTKKLLNKPKRDKILFLDSYEAVYHAVWDFLQMQDEVNALKFAKLAEKIIRTEKGEVLRENATDLFREKQDLGFEDFKKTLAEIPQVKTARQLLEAKKQKQLSPFSKQLKGLLAVPPPPKKGK